MWQALLDALGSALAVFYDFLPSYGVAIILLTVAVRLLMLPLTIKQTRSMHEMQKIQPQLKAIQQKYKGNRQKISEETMKLYKEHRVNPLGGCLPLLLQLPVFFALFSVLRASIPAVAVPVEPIPESVIEAENVFCAPPGARTIEGGLPDAVVCDVDGETETFGVSEWRMEEDARQDIFTRCDPVREEGETRFRCNSAIGTGNLPSESELFEDIVEDRTTFLGIHLSCGATQAGSEDAIRDCAPPGTEAGGARLIGYYGLIALMVVTTWYQTRQMQSSAQGQQQMQMIGRIMPVFLGFISLSIPAGVLVYWVTTNLWQVGQQHVMLRSREAQPVGSAKKQGEKTAGGKGAGDGKSSAGKSRQGGPQGRKDSQPSKKGSSAAKKPGGRNARRRKKRRKR